MWLILKMLHILSLMLYKKMFYEILRPTWILAMSLWSQWVHRRVSLEALHCLCAINTLPHFFHKCANSTVQKEASLHSGHNKASLGFFWGEGKSWGRRIENVCSILKLPRVRQCSSSRIRCRWTHNRGLWHQRGFLPSVIVCVRAVLILL